MISIIVAVGKNREIGRKNQLLFNIPEDMQRFIDVTKGHTVVMGEKTFQSIGKPLPGRKNIVVTLDKNYKAPGCETRYSLDDVLRENKETKEEIFVIGGGQIYKLSLPYADKLYITEVDAEILDADTYFPDYSEFSKVVYERSSSDDNYKYKFLELERE
jgi:dihydrofolate reductase